MKKTIQAAIAIFAVSVPIAKAQQSTKARQSDAVRTTTRSGAQTTYGPWRVCKMGGGGYIQNVVASPTNARRYYTYVDVGGLSRSDDGGQSWKMLHGSLPVGESNTQVRGLLVDPRDDKKIIIATGSQWSKPEGIYVSSDAGETWRKTLSANYAGNGDDRWTGFLLARHPQNPNIVLTASEGTGVFQSVDNGQSWKKLGLEGIHPTDIRFDRSDANRIWLCAQGFNNWMGGAMTELKGGFFRSQDGGATWTKLSDKGPTETMQDPRDATRLYGTTDQRIVISRDAGATWQDFSDGLAPREEKPGYLSEGAFQSLAAGPDFIVTASTKGTFYTRKSGESKWRKIERQGLEEVYEGEEWFRHKDGGFGSALGSITIDPRDSNHWFFTDWYAIYQTRDAGKNWKLSMDGMEVTVLHALTQDATDPGVVHLGMADNGYLQSENGGERFHLATGISGNVKSVVPAPSLPNRVYGVGPINWDWRANQLFVSIDRGAHWSRSPMTGLPDMTVHNCNALAVDARNPYVVYLAVSKEVAPNKGGVYKSVDGGLRWTWMGEGLPPGKEFFVHDIWQIGREIAVSPDGSLVCFSRNSKDVRRFDAQTKTWIKIEGIEGAPWSVVADASKPSRFFIGGDAGIWRTDDGARNWKQVFATGVHHVAVDSAKPNRVAAGTADGVVLSEDGGATWRMLDKRLPYRIYNLVAFAGERLLAGTAGNGAFWMPLNDKGLKPVRARAIVEAALPGTSVVLPQVVNGDMTLGTTIPDGWTNVWQGAGKLEARRDTQNFKGAPASLSVRSGADAAYGSVSQSSKAVASAFKRRGFARANGEFKEALVAVQSFDAAGKQVDWINLSDARDAKEWKAFDTKVSLSPNAATWKLVVILNGKGEMWLDEVKLQAASDVFLAQADAP